MAKKYKAMWYNHITVVKEEPELIIAEDSSEAVDKAYKLYDGNPPASELYLEEVE